MKCVFMIAALDARWLDAVSKLAKDGHRCAVLTRPVFALSKGHGTKSLGRWAAPNLFVLEPRSLTPLHAGPFKNTAIAWKGADYFSRPRTSTIVREAGFDQCDVVLMADFSMPYLVRAFQAKKFYVVSKPWTLDGPCDWPAVAQRRWIDLERDADVLLGTEGISKRVDDHEVAVVRRDNWIEDSVAIITGTVA